MSRLSQSDLDALRACVNGDPVLALRLRRSEPQQFIEAVLRAAAERGIAIERDDIEAAIVEGAKDWTLRWVR